MMPFICPLCGSERFVEVQCVNSKDIIKEYIGLYGVDVTRFFPEVFLKRLQCVGCGLLSYSPAPTGDSSFYDELQKLPYYYEDDKPEFDFAISKIVELQPETVLEIGCGQGAFLRRIREAFSVKGCEYSRVSQLKLLNAGISFDLPADTYDFIACFQVLEHVSAPRDFLCAAVNKLNAGGHLLVTVPNNDATYFREVHDPLDYPPHHVTQWPEKALKRIAGEFQLDIVSYYIEPHRIEHYRSIINGRRRKLLPRGMAGRFTAKIAALADAVLTPYFFDFVDYPGHTHGLLMRK